MSIASEITRINTNIANAYTQCDNKGATMPQTQNSANLANTIASITGGVEIPEKDVNFYDFDGTILYSYTKEEIAEMSELPALPEHEGLTAIKWGIPLNKIKKYAAYGNPFYVGVQYRVTNGNTKLYITVDDSTTLNPTLYVKISNGTLSVLVDEQVVDSRTNATASEVSYNITINIPTPQEYPKNYVIELSFSGSGFYRLGQGTMQTKTLGANSKYCNLLRRVDIGNSCTLVDRAFQYYNNLKTVILTDRNIQMGTSIFQGCLMLDNLVWPDTINSVGYYVLNGCPSLKKLTLSANLTSFGNFALTNCYLLNNVIIPDSVTTFGTNNFNTCCALQNVVIPDGITTIPERAFNSCNSITKITIPDGVTSIGATAFGNCYALREVIVPNSVTSFAAGCFSGDISLLYLDLSSYVDASSIPSMVNTNVLSNVPTDIVIWVANQEMLNAFSQATNWSTYASKMQIKGE